MYIVLLLSGLILSLSGCGEALTEPEETAQNWGTVPLDGKADIYGEDSRYDLYDTNLSANYRSVGKSVAMIFSKRQIGSISRGSHNIGALTLSDRQKRSHGAPMCTEERFKDDPSIGFCSGFLIAPNLVATAGHCMNTVSCDDMAFVFEYAKANPADNTTAFPSRDVFECKRIVGNVYNASEPHERPLGELHQDWAVIELDRTVDRPVLEVGYDAHPSTRSQVATVGHPSGLAMKATIGSVFDNSRESYFNTDIDAYQGNSGGAIVDSSGVVRGIVTQGTGGFGFKKNTDDDCFESRTCDAVGSDFLCFGNQAGTPKALKPFQSAPEFTSKRRQTNKVDFDDDFKSSIFISDRTPISLITLNAKINTEKPSDLTVSLEHVGGNETVVVGMGNRLNGGLNITRSTAAFNGELARGIWRLRVKDAGDAKATIEWWELLVVEAADEIVEPTERVVPIVPAWIGSGCSDDADCNFVQNGSPGFCYSEDDFRGFCTIPCAGFCPDKTGVAGTFCIGSDLPDTGVCTVRPAASNRFCEDLPGTSSGSRRRFVGDTGVSAQTRTVCAP